MRAHDPQHPLAPDAEVMLPTQPRPDLGLVGFLVVAVLALGSWSLYASIAYWLGTGILKGPETRAGWGEVARCLGFAQSPGLLLVFETIPGLGSLVTLAVRLWILAATVVGLRAALDITTGRAIVVGVSAWLVQAVLTAVLIALQAS